MKFEWSDSLTLGETVLDAQHKEIFNRANAYAQAFANKATADDMVQMLNFLVEYVKEHFSHEESYMQFLNYPNIEEHKLAHKHITQELVAVYKQLIAEGATDSINQHLTFLINRWITSHIEEMDAQIIAFKKGK